MNKKTDRPFEKVKNAFLKTELALSNLWTKFYVRVVVVLAAAALIFICSKTTSLYFQRNLIMVGFYLLLALSLNFIQGYLGHCFIGMAGFYQIGAYATVILTTLHSWPYLPAVLVGCLVTMAIGMLFALATQRLSGTYLCATTLAFFYVELNLIRNWESLTNGAVGIQKIPPANFFGIELSMKNGGYLYVIMLYCLIAMIVTRLIVNSKVGRAIKAVRDDSLVSTLMGVENTKYKIIAYAFCGFFAGLAGSLYGPFVGYLKPTTFTYDMGMIPFVIIILGGIATIKGAILGAVIVAPLAEYLRMLTKSVEFDWLANLDPEQWRYVIYGIILVVMMRFKPKGLLGGQERTPFRLPKGVGRKES